MEIPDAAKRAELFRKRAGELRSLALRQVEGSDIRDQLLKAAADYEEMAVRAEHR